MDRSIFKDRVTKMLVEVRARIVGLHVLFGVAGRVAKKIVVDPKGSI